MKIKEINFLEHIGNEEQNFLTSMINFREEFDLFGTLDSVYQNPLKRLEVKPSESIIGQLHLLVHSHLYFSVSCIMRCHLSEALSSLRKAIDASLSAYEIILNPKLTEAYIDKDNPDNKRFIKIKAAIKKAIEKNKNNYPLAHQLIEMHETCSAFGSHADFNSFIYRLEVKEIPGEKKGQLLVGYFQFPKNQQEYKLYFIVVLLSFWHIFKIFKVFFDDKLKIIDPQWEKEIEALGTKLNQLREKYWSQLEAERGKH